MNIESLSTTGVQSHQMSGATPMIGGSGAHARMDNSVSEIAASLNISTSQLSSALGTTKSLVEIATSQGASSNSVMDAITKAIKASASADGRVLPDSAVRQIADHIANYKGARYLAPNGRPPQN